MKRLKDIAEIRSGYTFRNAIGTLAEGDIRVVQAKDLANFNPSSMPAITFILKGHGLKSGDILLGARGNFTAHALTDVGAGMVASSSVFIIRPKIDSVRSDYLVAYLNAPIGQKKLRAGATGSAIPTLLKPALMNMMVAVPHSRIQEHIADIAINIHEQSHVIAKKQALLNALFTGTITQAVKETTI